MTKLDFANAMALLVSGTGKALTDDQVAAWFELLSDLTVDQLRRGIVETLRTYQFGGIPPIGLIRKNALGGIQSANLEVADRALLAWDRVLTAIRTIGGYRTVSWDDPVIPATIRAIATSWAGLCETESATLHVWTKKAFLETYRVNMAAGQVTAIAASPLPGLLAESGARAGYDQPEAVPVETRLPVSIVKVLPGPIHSPRFDPAVETVGKSLRLPVVTGGNDPDDVGEGKAIEDVEGKRAAVVARMRAKFDHLVRPAK